MKRPLVIAVVAILIFCGGFCAVAIYDPFTLVKKTVHLDEGDHVFRIRYNHGQLYASVTAGGSGNGSSIGLIGSVQDVGTADPRILVDEEHHRVLLYVGKGGAEYDAAAKSLRTWPGML